MVKALGVNSVKINPVCHIERADRMRDSGEILSVKETIDFYYRLSGELEKDGIGGVTFDIPPAFQRVKNMRFNRINTCGIFNILGILGDGKLSICGIGSSLETLVLGRIGKDRIEDIWRSHAVLREIREGVPAKLEGVCGQCMMKRYCLGKCRAEAYYSKGSLLAPLVSADGIRRGAISKITFNKLTKGAGGLSKTRSIARSKKVLTADFPQAKVVFNTATRRPYVLNGTASVVWDFCKRPRGVESIVAYLGRRYDVTTARARRDVKGLLDTMRKAGIMR